MSAGCRLERAWYTRQLILSIVRSTCMHRCRDTAHRFAMIGIRRPIGPNRSEAREPFDSASNPIWPRAVRGTHSGEQGRTKHLPQRPS